MKKIIIATTNKNKVKRLKALLSDSNYELISLKDIDNKIIEPNETGCSHVQIAIEKASHYANFLPDDIIVLAQDDTIVFEGVSEEDNPGAHIKEPVIKKYGEFSDELAAKYYKALADKYGGSIPMTFKYGHAIAIKNSSTRYNIKVIGAESELKARLVNKINKLETVQGYFLSALMEVEIDGRWLAYNELDEEELVKLDSDLYGSIKTLLDSIN